MRLILTLLIVAIITGCETPATKTINAMKACNAGDKHACMYAWGEEE